MTIKEANVTINVNDMNKSIAFYESVGLTLKAKWGNHCAQFIAPGIAIGLHPTAPGNLKKDSGNISIGFTVDNFEIAESLLHQLDIKTTIRKEEGEHFLHFNDPDGSALYFMQPNRK